MFDKLICAISIICSSCGPCPCPWGSGPGGPCPSPRGSGLVLVLALGGQVLVLVLVLGGQVLVNIPDILLLNVIFYNISWRQMTRGKIVQTDLYPILFLTGHHVMAT